MEPFPDPPGVVWYRQYTSYSPGIEGLHVSAENAVTIAGGVLDSFKSVLPNSEEVDLVGEGSFVLRYEDDALAWAVHDGGRSNYLLEVLDDGAVITVGNYVDAGRVFGEGSPQEVALPSTFGDGMYVARYSDLGVLEWALAASDGNPGATQAAIDPIGELSVLGFTNGGTHFQPDGATVDEGLFRAGYSLDGLGMWLSAGPPISIDAPRRMFGYGLWVAGPEYWSDGSSVFAGFFCGTLIVAPGEPNETELVSDPPECGGPNGPYTDDAIIARYTPDGSLEWILAPVTPGYVAFYSAHVTSSGRIQVVGEASEPLELVDTHGAVASIDGPSHFVAVFEQDGELAWLRRIESEYAAPVSAVTLDDEVVLVGQMYDSVVVVDAGLDGEKVLTG